jgi:flagellar basal body-associated protein FliL
MNRLQSTAANIVSVWVIIAAAVVAIAIAVVLAATVFSSSSAAVCIHRPGVNGVVTECGEEAYETCQRYELRKKEERCVAVLQRYGTREEQLPNSGDTR